MTLREEIQNRTKTLSSVLAVSTPEWPGQDGKVFVRKLTAREMDCWYNRVEGDNARAQYVAIAACDDAGNRIFGDGDSGWLGNEPFSVIDRIYEAGMIHNRTTPAAKASMEKNS